MSCKHLTELYELCRAHDLRLSSTDLIRILCPICGVEEECPTMLCEQYEALHPEQPAGREGTGDQGPEGSAAGED